MATTTTTTIPMNTTAEDVYSKEQIVTQKLSINLKRLHNTYTTSCRPPDSAAAAAEENDDDSAGSEDFSGDQVPNFPPLNSPLVVRLNAQPAVAHAVGANGRWRMKSEQYTAGIK